MKKINKKTRSQKTGSRKKSNIKKQNLDLKSNESFITLKSPGVHIGKGYSIEYTRSGNIYKHRLERSQVHAGKGFVLIMDKTLNITPGGIVGG